MTEMSGAPGSDDDQPEADEGLVEDVTLENVAGGNTSSQDLLLGQAQQMSQESTTDTLSSLKGSLDMF